MDAYSSYIIQTSDARLRDLRREAAEYRLSRIARGTRASWWSRARNGLRRSPVPAVEPEPTVSLPAPAAAAEGPLRRTA